MLRVFQIPLLKPWSAKYSRGEESTEITKLMITGSWNILYIPYMDLYELADQVTRGKLRLCWNTAANLGTSRM